ncbi:MAG: hypothetical protein IJE81_02490 [Oscillospiraceae bacterium]|nr:hypothetical protein [Oscillospiraceae bacterium]MBQ7130707.1 hypothetical protein [Oscillospiraceae bacterium]
MSIRNTTITQLRQMEDQEGLVLQGCGGSLREWQDGINHLLTEESTIKVQLTSYLNRFLKDLSREDRYLFLRRYWHGDRVDVIAHSLGITPHLASVRLFRLRQKLKYNLQREGMLE